MTGFATVVAVASVERGPAGPYGAVAYERVDCRLGTVLCGWNGAQAACVVWGEGVPTAVLIDGGMAALTRRHGMAWDVHQRGRAPSRSTRLVVGGREGVVDRPGALPSLLSVVADMTRSCRAVRARLPGATWEMSLRGMATVPVRRDGVEVARYEGRRGVRLRLDLGATPDDVALAVLLGWAYRRTLFLVAHI